ncbi:hypothetical protein ACIP4Q_27595 [Streptomyces massasporeus]
MGRVLTTASTVTCPHATGPPPPPPTPVPGLVKVTSTEKLKVLGSPVLVKTSLTTVSACPNAASGGAACTSVTGVLGGESAKLRTGGRPVLLDALVLATNVVPTSSVSPAPHQSKLSSV